jgi:hypothetical protein
MNFLPRKRAVFVLLAVAGVLLLPLSAMADLYGFNGITNNMVNDTNIGEAQLQLAVTPVGSTGVQFEFTNVGSAACSITDIYFYTGGSYLNLPPAIENGRG